MSSTIDIEIFMIAKSVPNTEAMKNWVSHLGAINYNLPQVKGIDEDGIVTSADLIVGLPAKRCYLSFEPGLNPNVTKVRSDWFEYLTNILKSGHGSVCEHATFSFAIEGVSRVFTGEMNRHRAGVAISEGSMRYIRFNDIPYWLPTSLQPSDKWKKMLEIEDWNGYDILLEISESMGQADPDDLHNEMDTYTRSIWENLTEELTKLWGNIEELKLEMKKFYSRMLFKKQFDNSEVVYSQLEQVWKEELFSTSSFHVKKLLTSMMRRIVPMGVATGGVWTLNVRSLRHIMALRASAAAEEEICHVFSRIGKMMVENEPNLFGDFTNTPEGYWIPKYPKV